MTDETENARRERIAELNSEAGERAALEARHGKVWSTDEVRQEFTVIGFMAPFVVVQKKGSREKGSLEFQHSPRYYFNYVKDEVP